MSLDRRSSERRIRLSARLGTGRLRAVLGVLLVTLLGPALRGDTEGPQIADLLVNRQGSQVLVSFQLLEAFDETTLRRIESGLPTGFTYQMKLERLRRWWFDRRMESSSLQVVAMYNAITREYLVNYKQDGDLIDSRVVTTVGELEQAMTIFHLLPAFELEDRAEERLVVRVRAVLGSRTILALIPTAIHTDWAESLQFRTQGVESARASG